MMASLEVSFHRARSLFAPLFTGIATYSGCSSGTQQTCHAVGATDDAPSPPPLLGGASCLIGGCPVATQPGNMICILRAAGGGLVPTPSAAELQSRRMRPQVQGMQVGEGAIGPLTPAAGRWQSTPGPSLEQVLSDIRVRAGVESHQGGMSAAVRGGGAPAVVRAGAAVGAAVGAGTAAAAGAAGAGGGGGGAFGAAAPVGGLSAGGGGSDRWKAPFRGMPTEHRFECMYGGGCNFGKDWAGLTKRGHFHDSSVERVAFYNKNLSSEGEPSCTQLKSGVQTFLTDLWKRPVTMHHVSNLGGEDAGRNGSVPSDSAAGAYESLDTGAGARTEPGGRDWSVALAILYCLLMYPALGVAVASLFTMDNPHNDRANYFFLPLFIVCCWAMLPALAISAAALACLGSGAGWLRWLPPCVFCAAFVFLVVALAQIGPS